MSSRIPQILPTVVIGDDPHLLAQVTTLLARPRAYLPLLDGPRIHRPDLDAEVIRRNNAVARVRPDRIIFAGLPASTCDLFSLHFPTNRTARIVTIDELPESIHGGHARPWTLRWGRDKLGLGVLRALRDRQRISFDASESPADGVALHSNHVVVCEEGDEHAQVLAANYAYSLDAGLCLIPSFPSEEADELLESLYGCQENRTVSPTSFLTGFKERLRAHAGPLPLRESTALTFITSKLPWGVAFPEIPSTHLFRYPDLGVSLINGLIGEQPNTPGIRSAVAIDPQLVNSNEVQVALERLTDSGVFSKALRSTRATVHQAANTIALFPYDLLLISTHCGDVSGWRWTCEFVDSEGLRRTLVVDIAVGAQIVPGKEDVKVSQFIRFVSLDGVAWNDKQKKKTLHVGTAIRDFTEMFTKRSFEPARREDVPRVPGSMALAMADGNYILLPQPIASRGSPIVINNACGSWHRLAGNFMFGNARCYVGTLFSVLDPEAQQIIEKLFGEYLGTELTVGLWRAQNDLYGESVRRPYALVGCHFQRIRMSPTNALGYVVAELSQAVTDWQARLGSLPATEKSTAKSIREMIEYLEADLRAIRDWQNTRATGPDPRGSRSDQ